MLNNSCAEQSSTVCCRAGYVEYHKRPWDANGVSDMLINNIPSLSYS